MKIKSYQPHSAPWAEIWLDVCRVLPIFGHKVSCGRIEILVHSNIAMVTVSGILLVATSQLWQIEGKSPFEGNMDPTSTWKTVSSAGCGSDGRGPRVWGLPGPQSAGLGLPVRLVWGGSPQRRRVESSRRPQRTFVSNNQDSLEYIWRKFKQVIEIHKNNWKCVKLMCNNKNKMFTLVKKLNKYLL